MARNVKGYYSLDGVVDYKKFLKHFQSQAEGRDKAVLFNGSQNRGKKSKITRPLVVVDLADTSNIADNKAEKPKIEVVEPTEADRLRAVGEIKRESKYSDSLARNTIKGRSSSKRNHSTSGDGKVNSNNKRKVVSKVKRAKDVFD